MNRALNPVSLCDALALHHASSLTTREYYSLKVFLKRWARPHMYPRPDTVVFNSLARRQALIEWFLRDMYAEHVQQYVFDRPAGDTHHNLGPSEIIRIQRAFYRFDLYAALFAENLYPNVDYDDLIDLDEIRETYLTRIPPWEIAELTCVHAYLHRRLWQQAHTLDHSIPLTSKTLSQDDVAQQFFQSFFESYSTREHFLSLGLGFINSIFTSPREKKFQIAGTNAGYADKQRFLASMLRLGTSVWSIVQEKPDFSKRMALKTVSGPSPGWLWVHGKKEGTNDGRAYKGDMLGWGYCLWDRQRMERLVELDQPFDKKSYAAKLPWNVGKSMQIGQEGRVKLPNPS
ncbi:hypothetical protein MMC10_007166 [Thelotrema lepadinum]|nr:hypothetical protein [Thelotrema lepadinum]